MLFIISIEHFLLKKIRWITLKNTELQSILAVAILFILISKQMLFRLRFIADTKINTWKSMKKTPAEKLHSQININNTAISNCTGTPVAILIYTEFLCNKSAVCSSFSWKNFIRNTHIRMDLFVKIRNCSERRGMLDIFDFSKCESGFRSIVYSIWYEVWESLDCSVINRLFWLRRTGTAQRRSHSVSLEFNLYIQYKFILKSFDQYQENILLIKNYRFSIK